MTTVSTSQSRGHNCSNTSAMPLALTLRSNAGSRVEALPDLAWPAPALPFMDAVISSAMLGDYHKLKGKRGGLAPAPRYAQPHADPHAKRMVEQMSTARA